jgi:hypothetical protein
MVKRTCAMLVRLQDEGVLDTGEVVFRPDAVEDEV